VAAAATAAAPAAATHRPPPAPCRRSPLTAAGRTGQDYLGVLTEESVRRNFLLLYELLDEVFDCGCPQAPAPPAPPAPAVAPAVAPAAPCGACAGPLPLRRSAGSTTLAPCLARRCASARGRPPGDVDRASQGLRVQ